MEARDITKAKIEAYLKQKGIKPHQLFGEGKDRLDPIDRHIIMRDLYQEMVGYRMEKEGLTLVDPKQPKVKIIYTNMKNFDEIKTLENCITNLKFIAYSKEVHVSRHMDQKIEDNQIKDLTLQELDAYFQKEHGKSIKDLYRDSSYYRYTKEGSEILLSGIEHYTGWQMGKFGLQIQDSNEPRAYLAHPKVKSIRDLKSLEEYLAKINELRQDRRMHERMLNEGTRQAKKQDLNDSLKQEVSQFLKKSEWNFEMLFDHNRSGRQRKEKMNEVLKNFARTYINEENNIIILNPIGKESLITNSGDFSLSDVQDIEHFMHIIKGFKQNRDLSFFIASPFVKGNHEITEETIRKVCQEQLGCSIDSILSGSELSKTERRKQLDALHFYITEAHQDRDMDMVISHPQDEMRTINFKEIKDKETYYDSIKTVDDFRKKAIEARKHRDLLHQNMERLKQLPKSDQDKNTEILKDDDYER